MLKNSFFLPTSNKSTTKNDTDMQLISIFHKTVNRNKMKVRAISLIVLQQLKCKWNVKGKFLYSYHYLCTHKFSIAFSLKSFYHNCQFIFFYCFTPFFSYASSLFLNFSLYILWVKINEFPLGCALFCV